MVSAPPVPPRPSRARIAASSLYGALTLSNLAGGQKKTLVPSRGTAPDWSPAGDRIVYFDDYGLAVTDTAGTANRVATPDLNTVGWGQYSADGQWIYFQAYRSGQTTSIWRIRSDGTGLAAVLPAGTYGARPSPSPDGYRVAYFSGSGVAIFDLRTGSSAAVPNALSGEYIRWSPDGQRIAVAASSSSYTIRPDGSDKKPVTGVPNGFFSGVAWSPDSRWILFGGGTSALVETATGNGFALPLSASYPAWKR